MDGEKEIKIFVACEHKSRLPPHPRSWPLLAEPSALQLGTTRGCGGQLN